MRAPTPSGAWRIGSRQSSDSGSRSVEVEPIWVQPQWAIVHLLHCLLAIVGSVLAPSEPVIGFAIVLVAATSAYLDLSGRWYLIRRLLFRRASQNVHVSGRSGGAAPADAPRVILCANLDAPRTGAAYNPTADAAARPRLEAIPGRLIADADLVLVDRPARCCRSARGWPGSRRTGSTSSSSSRPSS